jgi:glucose-6-phosphate 1-dehydrogenase
VFDGLPPVLPYEQGTWGPAEADALIAPRRWLTT